MAAYQHIVREYSTLFLLIFTSHGPLKKKLRSKLAEAIHDVYYEISYILYLY